MEIELLLTPDKLMTKYITKAIKINPNDRIVIISFDERVLSQVLCYSFVNDTGASLFGGIASVGMEIIHDNPESFGFKKEYIRFDCAKDFLPRGYESKIVIRIERFISH